MVYVYGGSFNPPTLAHKRIVDTLLKEDPQAKVIVIPVGNDYKKSGLIDVKHRLHMLDVMFSNEPNVTISDLETKRPYQGTLKTLDELSTHYDKLCYVIGSDQLPEFETWINYKTLLEKYPFVIMMRHDMQKEDAERYVKDFTHHFTYISFSEPMSSSDIRLKKQGYKKYLDKAVLDYIEKQHLYKE